MFDVYSWSKGRWQSCQSRIGWHSGPRFFGSITSFMLSGQWCIFVMLLSHQTGHIYSRTREMGTNLPKNTQTHRPHWYSIGPAKRFGGYFTTPGKILLVDFFLFFLSLSIPLVCSMNFEIIQFVVTDMTKLELLIQCCRERYRECEKERA